MFLFKSRLLVCKVRRISDDRSVFVLRDIVRLPDAEIVEQPHGTSGFEVRLKAIGVVLQFCTHQAETCVKWLREIGHYASDPLALHEHAVDDLRIDATQVKADTDADAFRLPPRIDAHQPDAVKPSEVAQDYLPTVTKLQQQQQQSTVKLETSSTTKQQQETIAETPISTAKSTSAKAVSQSTQQSTESSASAIASASVQIEKHAANVTTVVESKSADANEQSFATKSTETSHVELKTQIDVHKSASEETARVEAKNQINLCQSFASSSQSKNKQSTDIKKDESATTVSSVTATDQKSPEPLVQGTHYINDRNVL